MKIVTKQILKKVYKNRKKEAHKGDYGSLLVVGGSKLYSGAPTLLALAALKAGTDLVTVASPERAANIIASFKPDLITYPLKGDYLSMKHLDEIFLLLDNKTALAIGNGLSRNSETLEAIKEIIRNVNLPIIIDADAIHAVAEDKNIIKGKKVVITPHAYEFFILTGEKLSNKFNERIKQVKNLAKDFKCIILLKGNIDIISDGKKIILNKTGNPYMTKGGTGDILAGILAGLVSQGTNLFEASCAAAFINGKAADLAASQKKQSFLASDILDFIEKVI